MAQKMAQEKTGHVARARAVAAPMSTKHAIEICHHIRHTTTSAAKRALEDTINLTKAIPFKHFNRDLGHKPGMAAGRYPQKAAAIVLSLVKSLEANAQDIGLDTSSLKISKAIANRAASPMTGGRRRTAAKRTHIELEVIEYSLKSKKGASVSKNKKVASIKPKITVSKKQDVSDQKSSGPQVEAYPEVKKTIPDQKIQNSSEPIKETKVVSEEK
jgi:large subunit ribosomal protein L22